MLKVLETETDLGFLITVVHKLLNMTKKTKLYPLLFHLSRNLTAGRFTVYTIYMQFTFFSL